MSDAAALIRKLHVVAPTIIRGDKKREMCQK